MPERKSPREDIAGTAVKYSCTSIPITIGKTLGMKLADH
jgi:hypothetical protein